MGIKLNVGISKKIGLPDYGSAGSQCNVELELDNSTLDRPKEFHRQVHEAYAACRSAVEDELDNHRVGVKQDARPTPPPKTDYNESRFPVSPKQLDFIGKLSKGIKGLGTYRTKNRLLYLYGTWARIVAKLIALALLIGGVIFCGGVARADISELGFDATACTFDRSIWWFILNLILIILLGLPAT